MFEPKPKLSVWKLHIPWGSELLKLGLRQNNVGCNKPFEHREFRLGFKSSDENWLYVLCKVCWGRLELHIERLGIVHYESPAFIYLFKYRSTILQNMIYGRAQHVSDQLMGSIFRIAMLKLQFGCHPGTKAAEL